MAEYSPTADGCEEPVAGPYGSMGRHAPSTFDATGDNRPQLTLGAVPLLCGAIPTRKGISVVIPVFNSCLILPQLVQRLELVLRKTADYFELILVNDGSRDTSWNVISGLAATRCWLRGIDLARNFGQENAILCGIRHASFDICVILDDDLQNPPEEIPKLLAKLEEGHDVVYGVAHRERHRLWRSLGAKVTKFVLQEAMGTADARNVTAFKVLRTRLRETFAGYCSPHVAIDVLLTWGTQRFAAIGVRQDERLVGASNYTIAKLVSHAMNLLTGFSAVPMRLVGVLGAAVAFAGVVGGLVSAIHGATTVWAPLFVTGAVFCGIQLICVGLLSEYVLRMHARLMDRPPYAIRLCTDSGPAEHTGALDERVIKAIASITQPGQRKIVPPNVRLTINGAEASIEATR